MARLNPISNRTAGSHGPSLPPHTGGGGDDDRNSRDGMPDFMPNYGARLRRARLGLAVAMTPILMLFITFSVAYLVRRGFPTFDSYSHRYIRTWLPVLLPWPLLLANTAVLIGSSITMEFARRSITRQFALDPVKSIPGVSLGDERHFPWLALTTLLGATFLAGQVFTWSRLSARGYHLSGTSSSFVYFLTGMHALHLAGGALALLYADVATVLDRPVESRRIIIDITTWYWHCMTAIWIYILVLLSFAAR